MCIFRTFFSNAEAILFLKIGRRYVGKLLETLCLDGNKLVLSLAKKS